MTGTVWSIGSVWTGYEGMSPVVDAYGVKMFVTNVDGWKGSTSPRTSPIDVPLADGVYDGATTQSARSVTITGELHAPDQVTLLQAMDRLDNLLVSGTRYDTLTAAEAHLSRQALVRIDAQTQVVATSIYRATYSIILLAPDPKRYSTTLQTVGPVGIFAGGVGRAYSLTFPRTYGAIGSSGLLSVNNGGVFTAYPTLTFVGPLVNPVARLVGSGRLALALTLAATDTLIVQPRTVYLNGEPYRSALTGDSTWWGLVPGSSQILFTADSGAGTLAVSWRDPS